MGSTMVLVSPQLPTFRPDPSRETLVRDAANQLAHAAGRYTAEVKVYWFNQIDVVTTTELGAIGAACPCDAEVPDEDFGHMLVLYKASDGTNDTNYQCPTCLTETKFSRLSFSGIAFGHIIVQFIHSGHVLVDGIDTSCPEWHALENAVGTGLTQVVSAM